MSQVQILKSFFWDSFEKAENEYLIFSPQTVFKLPLQLRNQVETQVSKT